jgi:hypothetical protein
MGFTIYYTSTRSITPQEAEAIRMAVQKECEGRSWFSCEPPGFFPDLQDGRLIGGSKPNFRPHPDDKRAAESCGLPDGSLGDLLDILALLSREYAVDWELAHDYGPIGFIRVGIVDPRALAQIEAISAVAL